MMRWCAIRALWIGVTSSLMASAVAEPIVLYDSGETSPIAPYLAALRPEALPVQPTERRSTLPPLDPLSFGLPVSTPSMTPGRVAARSLPVLHGRMAGARPLFLIGADRSSLQWLTQNRDHLVRLHAVGMVIAARDQHELEALRQAAGPLPLLAASGEAIARELGLRHYPVLIAPPGVVEQ